jgi:hypothetical protein
MKTLVYMTVLLTVTASAGYRAIADSPGNFVVGGGHHSVPDTQFTLSAHSGPLGEDVKGQLSFKIDGGERFLVDVTCMFVVGNEAVATGVITRPASSAGDPVVMHAVDNGNPSDPTPDLLRFSFDNGGISDTFFGVGPEPPDGQDLTGCLFPTMAPVPVTQGNIEVESSQD